jgi:hypothetical protein
MEMAKGHRLYEVLDQAWIQIALEMSPSASQGCQNGLPTVKNTIRTSISFDVRVHHPSAITPRMRFIRRW